ncbi:CGNR zinc finger domain-containing protein [Streptomyces lavendulocolor]|uniref:CGNR zinc finger domain-containing protein n=1 Tax=Streptomyces lavendulocolor TaxID=67316 RepID=UPI0033DD3F98
MAAHPLALDLALTVRHDGHGGVADDLGDPDGLTEWVRERAAALPAVPDAARFTADAGTAEAVRVLRAAVRALFARAVPGGSRPDGSEPPPGETALGRLNEAAAAAPAVPHLTWPEGAAPAAGWRPAGPASPRDALCAALARDAIAFLAGPDLARLRVCHAPRCVRYFLKEHPRQEWCKPSCGNRARVARHHDRHRA